MTYKSVLRVEQEVEVTFPCFVKFSEHYTKLVNKDYCIRVANWSKDNFGIELCPLSQCNPFANDGWAFVSEEEFNSVYKKVSKRIALFNPHLNQPA